jgi:hypothetical protein
MSKSQTVYKVLGVTNNARISAVLEQNRKCCVEYRKNKKAHGYKGTPLYAFESKEDAIKFAESTWRHRSTYVQEVWKSNAEVLKNVIPAGVLIDRIIPSVIVKLWRNKSIKGRVPDGTVLCKSITIKEMVY